MTTLRPVPDHSTAALMTWFYEALNPFDAWSVEILSAALTGAQERMCQSSASELIAWAADVAVSGSDQALLAAKVIAAAHRAAGNNAEFVAWEERVYQYLTSSVALDLEDFAAARARIDGEAYQARPFQDPYYWASFALIGAG